MVGEKFIETTEFKLYTALFLNVKSILFNIGTKSNIIKTSYWWKIGSEAKENPLNSFWSKMLVWITKHDGIWNGWSVKSFHSVKKKDICYWYPDKLKKGLFLFVWVILSQVQLCWDGRRNLKKRGEKTIEEGKMFAIEEFLEEGKRVTGDLVLGNVHWWRMLEHLHDGNLFMNNFVTLCLMAI